MEDNPETMLELAAQIVSAHVANNDVPPDELAKLISAVHGALATAGRAASRPVRGEPAVPVKQSVRHDYLVCLDCGKHFSMLKRHLATDHQLTPEQYRQKWELPPAYPVVAADYARTRSELAKKTGLGRKPGGSRKSRKRGGR